MLNKPFSAHWFKMQLLSKTRATGFKAGECIIKFTFIYLGLRKSFQYYHSNYKYIEFYIIVGIIPEKIRNLPFYACCKNPVSLLLWTITYVATLG